MKFRVIILLVFMVALASCNQSDSPERSEDTDVPDLKRLFIKEWPLVAANEDVQQYMSFLKDDFVYCSSSKDFGHTVSII